MAYLAHIIRGLSKARRHEAQIGLEVVITRDGPRNELETGDDEEEISLRRFCGLAAPMGVKENLVE
jgi:hypothetical protein